MTLVNARPANPGSEAYYRVGFNYAFGIAPSLATESRKNNSKGDPFVLSFLASIAT